MSTDNNNNIQALLTRNTVQTVFAPSTTANSTETASASALSAKVIMPKDFPIKVVAEDTTVVPKGKGYVLSFEHALCVGRYTPDPSGAPVTKAVAPNRTTSAISVSEAEQAFKLGADKISKMILVPPQSTKIRKKLEGQNNNDDDDDDGGDDEEGESSAAASNTGSPLLAPGGESVSSLLSSMFKAAQIGSKKTSSAASSSAKKANDDDEPPLSQYALSTKKKNVREPPQDPVELQEVQTYSVICHAPNLNVPATLFFPISYDWPRRKALPGSLTPFEINAKDHPRWPPKEFFSSKALTTTFGEIKTKKYNSNTALLYRIGPGAVAFRVVSNAFEAAGMTYTPGGCYDHIDYIDVNAPPPPIESSSTSASWNVLWAKRCDPIVLGQMNSFQKINHLPGSWSIGRKDNLHRCIQKLQKLHGLQVFGEIAPRSFIYPAEAEDLAADVASNTVLMRKKRIENVIKIRYGKTTNDDGEEEEFEEEEECEEEVTDYSSSEEEEGQEATAGGEDENNGAQGDNTRRRQRSESEKYERVPGLYIVKPCASSCGNGIRVVRGMPKFPPSRINSNSTSTHSSSSQQRSFVVQRYLEPFIVDQRKFDLRLYVVLTGVNPLKVWLFDEGLVRFAAHKYTPDANLENSKIHLTNFSIGKDEIGSSSKKKNEDGTAAPADGGDDNENEIKWTITDWRKHFLESNEIIIPSRFRHLKDNREELLRIVQESIDEVVVKTVLSMEQDVRTECRKQCRDPTGRGCFEMFGIDVMLNSDLKPHIIEANIMPSLAATLDLDRAVKARMLAHMLSMIGVVPFCRNKERDRPTPPLGAFVPGVESSTSPLHDLPSYVYTAPGSAADARPSSIIPNPPPSVTSALHYSGGVNVPLLSDFNSCTESEKLMLAEAEAEVAAAGGFRRIYPCPGAHKKYSHLFSHGLCRNTYLLLSYAEAQAAFQNKQFLDRRK